VTAYERILRELEATIAANDGCCPGESEFREALLATARALEILEAASPAPWSTEEPPWATEA
jgi:hypothetical protein